MSHVTHMNQPYHTYKGVMSHIWMSHVTHMNQPYHTYKGVMSHISRGWRETHSCMRHDSLMWVTGPWFVAFRVNLICVTRLTHLCDMPLLNTLNHAATTLHHTATRGNTLQQTATHCNTLPHSATLWHTLPHSTTRCHALQHTATQRPASAFSRKGCENVFSHLDETIVSHLHVKRSSIVLHSVRCCTEQRQAATLSRKGREMAHSFVWHSYVWPDYPRVWRDSSICVHMDVAISRKGENVFPHLVLFTCSSFHV